MKKFGLFFLICFFTSVSITTANVKLPSIIGSHMVIQQNTNVSIWGWADPGEIVKVKGSWMKDVASVRTDKKGKWILQIKSPKAGGPYQIIIEGKNKIVLNDVLSGEVWLASGQSNMSFPLKKSEDAKAEIAGAEFSEIRLFQVEHTYSANPQRNCNGRWVKCSPETIKNFSAVAYFFGIYLYKKLNVPIGLISSNKGGSPIEAWINNKVLDDNFILSLELNNMWEKWKEEYPAAKKKYEDEIKVWKKNDNSSNKKPVKPTSVDMIEKPHRRPGFLYNAMIAPLIPYTIKGVIWYQGENNVERPTQYQKLFPLLISDWRNEWSIGNFPFYFVQIAFYNYKRESEKASMLREAQMMAMSVPNTGMVVTIDIGNINNMHPTDKQDVGKRLALWALAKTYGIKNIVYSGPIYKSMKKQGNSICLYFNYTGSGLMKKGKKLTQFEIAGKNKKFYKADAVINGNIIVVHSDKVPDPIAVRYGWGINSVPNLYNKEGLPAAPFRTDKW